MGLKLIVQDDSWSLLDKKGITVLTIKEFEDERQRTILAVSGDLRSDTVQNFKDELAAYASVGADITLDFAELKSISNACQMAILNVQQQMDDMNKGSVTLRNVPKEIYKVFETSNLHQLLVFE